MDEKSTARAVWIRRAAWCAVAAGNALAAAGAARGAVRVTRSWKTEPSEGGTLTRGSFRTSGGRVDVVAASYDVRSVVLRILDAPAGAPIGSVLHALEGTNEFLAAINGGYFTSSLAPDGLLIQNGATVSPLRSDFSGAVGSLKDGTPFVATLAEFRAFGPVRDAEQSFPFIVDPGGKLGIRTDVGSPARRSIVLLGANRIAFAVTTECGLLELAKQMLRTPQLFGTPSIERALNLDGGPSTTMSVALRDGGHLLIPELGPLRTVLTLSLP